jgi:hypothetical protein
VTKTLRTSLLSIILALALSLVTVLGALAAPPGDVHIEVNDVIGASDPFVASGTAVAQGLCAYGIVDDVSIVATDTGTPTRILHVLKRFHCGDGSGTFDLRMTVQLDTITHETTASWRIVGGTGAYVHLHGHGTLVGTPIVPNYSVHDVYDGFMIY